MPTLRNVFIGSLALALAGCPTPPPSSGGDQPGQPGEGPPGQPGEGPPGQPGQPGDAPAPGVPGEGPQAGNNTDVPTPGPPPEAGDMPEAPKSHFPLPGDLPSFDDLIGSGQSITITVNVAGAESGQIDFQTIEEKDGNTHPKILHVEKFSNGTVTVKAPANYEGDVYISANGFSGENGHSGGNDVTVGGAAEAVALGSTDLVVEVSMDKEPEWMKQFLMKMPPPGEGEAPAPKPGDPPPIDGAPPPPE